MFSMTSLLATLPAASLAESDLPRFVTRTFGRRQASELPGLRAVLDEETLTGYPPALGAILAASAERMVAESIDPGALDPPMAERLLASSAFLRAVERRRPMDRQLLRPGEILSPPLREMLGGALHVLTGVGPQLALVAPVAVVHLPGVRYSIPRGVVMARAMTLEEADAMRLAWGAVEEAFPIEDPEAAAWHARFVVIARRPNHDAMAVATGLAALPIARRHRVWAEIIEHLRDQEVVDEHRPGQRGLAARLGKLGVTPDAPWIAPLVTLAEHVFAGCGPEPEALRGVCECTQDDIETFCNWVEIPVASRERLRRLSPPEVTRHLAALADIESGRLDVAFPAELVRPLRGFRDRLLKPRYGRAVAVLLAVDPLRLAEERVREGGDKGAILKALEALADEAGEAAAARPPVTLPLGGVPDLEGFAGEVDDEEAAPRAAAAAVAEDAPAITPEAAFAPVAASVVDPGRDGGVTHADGAAEPYAAAPAPVVERPIVVGPPPSRPRQAPPVEGVRPPQFTLPPMPAPPPPRPRPRTRPRSEFPPMPSGDAPLPPPPAPRGLIDPERIRVATQPPTLRAPTQPAITRAPTQPAITRAPTQPAITPVVAKEPRPTAGAPPAPAPRPEPASFVRTERPATSPHPPSVERPPIASSAPASVPRAEVGGGSRRRAPTVPHLVTPRQGAAFYEAAFKELELLERDLLRRGPWRAAHERIDALEHDAAELASALGPSARSGDKDFASALRRVEMVQAYLERVRPLLSGDGPPNPLSPSDPDDDAPRGGLRRFFGRRR